MPLSSEFTGGRGITGGPDNRQVVWVPKAQEACNETLGRSRVLYPLAADAAQTDKHEAQASA